MRMHEYLTRYGRSHAGIADHGSSYQFQSYQQIVLSALAKEGRGKKILDVGCMDGQFSRVLMDQFHDVWGVEMDPLAAELALKQGVHVKVANVEEGLPFEGSFFDGVHAVDMIEHLFDTKIFFQECYRVLKPAGFFIFAVPNLNSIENRIRVLRGGYLANVGAYPEDHFGQHIRIFNEEKIRELCSQTGFEIDEIRGIFSTRWNLPGLRSKVWNTSTEVISRWAHRLSKTLVIRARKRNS